MVSNETIKAIKEIIDTAEYCKNSYFWGQNGNASSRAWNEKRLSKPEVTWQDGNDEYTAEYTVRQSRMHTYAYGTYTKNGKKTNLTAIKNSYKRLTTNN